MITQVLISSFLVHRSILYLSPILDSPACPTLQIYLEIEANFFIHLSTFRA